MPLALAREEPRRRAYTAQEYIALAVPLAALLAIQASGAAAVALLRYDRAAIAAGQVWRLWTGNLVHANPRHLLMNAAAFALLWTLFVRDAPLRCWLAVSFGAATTIAACLWFLEPNIAWYVGLSGVLHGIWAAASAWAWRRERRFALLTLALLAAKLVAEQVGGPLTATLDAGMTVVVDAHAAGAAAGFVVAIILGNRSRATEAEA